MKLRFFLPVLLFFQSLLAQDAPVPVIVESWINAGSPQRSMIQSVGVRFENNASALVTAESLKVRSLTTGEDIDLSTTTLLYDPRNNSANWMFDRDTSALLADGNYLAWIDADTLVSDRERAACAASSTPLDDFVFNFHQLVGDTDGDRDVDFRDSCVLRETWLQNINQERYRSFLDFDLSSVVDEFDRGLFANTYFSLLAPEPGIHLYLRNDTGDDASDNATSLYNLAFGSTGLADAATWILNFGGTSRDITALVTNGAGVVDEDLLDEINGSPLAPGEFQATLEARDSSGAVLASQVLDFSYLGDVPCAPFFVSTPNPGVSLGKVTGAQPLSLAKWTVENYPGFQALSRWVVAPDGLSVTQTVNARPSALISDQSILNLRITGNFRVDTSGDDDFIGFIFGYQNSKQFYLFDWKQQTQNLNGGTALRGMSIKRIDAGDREFTEPDFWWSHQNRENTTVLSPPNDIPWKDFQDYQITLDFTPGRIVVEVHEEGTLLDRLEVEDDTFFGGRFGFYNYSQDRVVYSGFTQEALNNLYFYDADAEDPDGGTVTYSLVDNADGTPPPAGATMDARTGSLIWEPETAGMFKFTIVATDDDGLTDTQEFEVEVTPIDQPPVINILKTAASVFPGEDVTIQAVGSDAEQLFRTRLFIDGLEVDPNVGESVKSITRSFSEIGQIELRAIAIDSADQVSTITSYLRVLDPATEPSDGQGSTPINPPGQTNGQPTNLRPFVAIEAPTTSDDDPGVFIGSVNSGGGDLAGWFFEWAPAAMVDFNNLASPTVLWQELANGTAPFSSSRFASITAANFPDELIAFRLRAENTNGRGAITSIVFNPRSAGISGPTVETGAGNGDPALASFTAPLTVSDDRTMIRGTIDPNGGTLQSWVLDYAPRNVVDTNNLSDPAIAWTILAQNTTPQTDALLATLDPADFQNQVYLFRLSARNTSGAGTIATLVYNPVTSDFAGPGGSTGEIPATAQRPVCRIAAPQLPTDDRTMLIGSILANGGTLQNWIVDYAPRTQVNPDDLTDPTVAWTVLAEGTDEKTGELLAPLTDPDFDAGTWIIRVRAFNTNGLGCLSSIQLDTGDTSLPGVDILSPESDTDIPYISEVTGTISANGGVIDSWKLELASTREVTLANLNVNANWTTIGSGNGEVTGGILGTIDPTALQNGSYILRLSARNTNGRGLADGIIIHVCGEAKVGNFRLEFEDVNIPLAGIPIRVTRIYDTLNANRSGDFGFGWSLGVGDPDLRETVPDTGDSYFFATPFEVGTRVFLTTPDGRRVGFTFNVRNPRNRFLYVDYEPYFEPDPGVYETLTIAPVDFERVEVAADGSVYTPLLPFGYNPDNYRLTTRDGLVYHVNQRTGLQRITDRNDQTVTFSRNEITHNSGQKITLSRDARNRITLISTPNGSIGYRYDSNGDLVELIDQAGGSTRFTYLRNPAHYLNTVATPSDAALGRFTRKVIYENGRVVRVEDADGNPIGIQDYDPDNFTGSETDAEGNVTILVYDESGNVVRRTSPEGNVTSLEFNDPANPNRPTARIEPDGRRFEFRYDSSGNPLEEKRPDGTRVENDFNSSNQLVAVRIYDANGDLIVNEGSEYDANGNLTGLTRQDGASASLTYNERGLPTSYTHFTGGSVTMTYNDFNSIPATLTYSDGRAITITSNPAGRVTEISYDTGYTEFREYDGAGRISRQGVVGGSSQEFTYDADGAINQIIDSFGRITTFERDNQANIIRQVFSHQSEAGADRVVNYERDQNGRLIALVDPLNNRTEFTYNKDGRLASQTDALGKTTTYTYENNMVASVTDRRGLKRSYTYASNGMIDLERWHDLSDNVIRTIDRDYDALSRISRFSSPDCDYQFTYDSVGRPLTTNNGGTPGVPQVLLTHSYGPGELPVSTTDSLGTTINYEYDSAEKMIGLTWNTGGNEVANVSMTRDSRQMISRIDRREGGSSGPIVSSTIYERNQLRGLLTAIRHLDAGDSPVAADSQILYEYNSEGMVTAITRGSDRTEYQYDRFAQLVSAGTSADPDAFESYSYDLGGNRLTSHLRGAHIVGQGNRLESDDIFDYEYDDEGNLVRQTARLSGEVTIYEWDHLNRNTRIEVLDSGGSILSFVEKTFDINHRIIVQNENGSIRSTVWDGARPGLTLIRPAM